MEKVFGDYWITNRVTSRSGEQIVVETLNFTTKEKADEYYDAHLYENSWYEHMLPPQLKVIKVNFVE